MTTNVRHHDSAAADPTALTDAHDDALPLLLSNWPIKVVDPMRL
jgi:hypothetical protein